MTYSVRQSPYSSSVQTPWLSWQCRHLCASCHQLLYHCRCRTDHIVCISGTLQAGKVLPLTCPTIAERGKEYIIYDYCVGRLGGGGGEEGGGLIGLYDIYLSLVALLLSRSLSLLLSLSVALSFSLCLLLSPSPLLSLYLFNSPST